MSSALSSDGLLQLQLSDCDLISGHRLHTQRSEEIDPLQLASCCMHLVTLHMFIPMHVVIYLFIYYI
jgi:hypothetical protein